MNYEDVTRKRTRISAERRQRACQILCGLPELLPGRRWALARACLLEFSFVALFFYVHISIVRACIGHFTNPGVPIAIGHALIVPVFIWSAGPGSGGHLVNTITFATALTGHTSWVRCALYLVSQIVGSFVGTWMTYHSIGWDFTGIDDAAKPEYVYNNMAGCVLGSHSTTSAFVQEFMCTLVLLVAAYGLAFDPLNGKLFAPYLAPPLIGMVLGLIIFFSAGLSVTPASPPGMTLHICLAPAVVSGHMPSHMWIYLVGPALAALFHSVIFYVAPPEHEQGGCFQPPLLKELVESATVKDIESIQPIDFPSVLSSGTCTSAATTTRAAYDKDTVNDAPRSVG